MYYPNYQQPHYTDSQPPQDGLTLKEKLAWSLAGIIVLGGAVVLIKRMVRKGQSDKQQRQTYIEGSSPAFAKQIKMAYANDGWWGTNTTALRETIIRIPSKQVFREVMDSYQKLYNSSLLRDMESELQSSEYNEMLAIIAAKPERYNSNAPVQQMTAAQYQSWAARLKAAFDKTYGPIPGTDEAAIRAVFNEIPTQGGFVQVGIVYKALYGRDLLTDLKSELEFWEYGPYMQIITQKPK